MSVIDRLDAEWDVLATSTAAADALARWGAADPALRFPTLYELQAHVECRAHDPDSADRVLAALARLASGEGDRLAARVLLQLLLPGCKALVRRYGGSDPEERAGVVLATAWDRILNYPVERRPRRVAANVLLDVRQQVTRHFTRNRGHLSLEELPPEAVLAVVPDDDGGAAASLLAWAVRHGHLDREEAHLIALTRLAGVRVADLARSSGTHPQTLRRRRLRAEERLRRAVLP